MIEFISALVANGTTVGAWGYAPWLPFDNFIPVIILAATGFGIIISNMLLAVMFCVSEVTSLIPTYGMWYAWDLDPLGVFGVWILNTVIIWVGQLWLLDYLARKTGYVLERPYEEEEENADDSD